MGSYSIGYVSKRDGLPGMDIAQYRDRIGGHRRFPKKKKKDLDVLFFRLHLRLYIPYYVRMGDAKLRSGVSGLSPFILG